jgi:hypothetical protein
MLQDPSRNLSSSYARNRAPRKQRERGKDTNVFPALAVEQVTASLSL